MNSAGARHRRVKILQRPGALAGAGEAVGRAETPPGLAGQPPRDGRCVRSIGVLERNCGACRPCVRKPSEVKQFEKLRSGRERYSRCEAAQSRCAEKWSWSPPRGRRRDPLGVGGAAADSAPPRRRRVASAFRRRSTNDSLRIRTRGEGHAARGRRQRWIDGYQRPDSAASEDRSRVSWRRRGALDRSDLVDIHASTCPTADRPRCVRTRRDRGRLPVTP